MKFKWELFDLFIYSRSLRRIALSHRHWCARCMHERTTRDIVHSATVIDLVCREHITAAAAASSCSKQSDEKIKIPLNLYIRINQYLMNGIY